MAYEVQDFESEVIQRSHEVPVVVDFWADWCGPCLMFAPVIEAAADRADGKWALVKVNTEAHQEIAERFRIQSLPTLKIFQNGEVVDEKLGALPEPELVKWIAQYAPSEDDNVIDDIRELVELQEYEKAGQLLKEAPDQSETCFLKARVALALEPASVAALVKQIEIGDEFFDAAQYVGRLAEIGIAAEKAPQGDTGDLLRTGCTRIREGNFPEACENFLKVLETERDFQEGAAKEALKNIFLLLGPRHEVTTQYQRQFSSLLFS